MREFKQVFIGIVIGVLIGVSGMQFTIASSVTRNETRIDYIQATTKEYREATDKRIYELAELVKSSNTLMGKQCDLMVQIIAQNAQYLGLVKSERSATP